ncbi:MAG: Anucleate primary sterigmata protein B [Phylliscum demangeonii]|nr:MAG: Anucleate primary sterigmata protein B [Phylliscum demangeonii]
MDAPATLEQDAHDDLRATETSSVSLSSLPAQEGSSLHAEGAEGDRNARHDLDGEAEQEMRRKLMDFESSFLPVSSPINQGERMNDNDVVDGRMSVPLTGALPSPSRDNPVRPATRGGLSPSSSPPTPPETYRTPAPSSTAMAARDTSPDVQEDSSLLVSSLETMSSPAAAAAARTLSRVMSMASVSGYETAEEGSVGRAVHAEAVSEDEEDTPRKPTTSSHPDPPDHDGPSLGVGDDESHDSVQPQVDGPEEEQEDTEDAEDAELAEEETQEEAQADEEESEEAQDVVEPASKVKARPSSARDRQWSHASTRTSMSLRSDGTASDVTLGADYALQSGGAAPESNSASRHNMELLRTISLGSIASGISAIDGAAAMGWKRSRDSSGAALHARSTSDVRGTTTNSSEGDRASTAGTENMAFDETPKASGRTLAAPTDTVIAQHVRDVQVPASIAREFRATTARVLGEPTAGGTSQMGRGKGLTLKEQSSTIDRLQKENFDLKLKVHYLNKMLNDRSDEGVKELLSENVELKVGLATMEKQNRTLRRTLADLERRLREREQATSGSASDPSDSDGIPRSSSAARAMEEEVTFLRERVQRYEREIQRLNGEGAVREGEKRRMAEMLKTLGERRRASYDVGAREEMDMWKDLYEAEMARREQADENIRKLQGEIWRLKNNGSVSTANGVGRSVHLPFRRTRPNTPRSISPGVHHAAERNGSIGAASSTVVEHLKHENEELRREVSAQTSMLTSRNREKERLYQEIEDLKLGQMRGEGVRSVAGDSIFERSASRAHERSASRVNSIARTTNLSETERDEYETHQGRLRDAISELKLRNQELESKLEECLDELEQQDGIKARREKEFEEEIELATGDVQTMQQERDEALVLREELEAEFETLKQEAQHEINALEAELEQKAEDVQQLERELSDRKENLHALQTEMRSMSDGLVHLEDDHRSGARKMVSLQQEVEDANKEIEALEKALREANAKMERFTVQLESALGEIAFLREEQDGDKMRIGDLESALAKAHDVFQEERDHAKELEMRIADERRQHDAIAGKEKEEVQKIVNDLNREMSDSREEIRKLRKTLSSREVEATEWKERLMELENNLRAALGDLSGTRSSLLKAVTKLQKDMEATVAELERTKARLAESERVLRHRDALVESAGLESRKLSEMLDRERQGRRVERHHLEQLEKTARQTSRTVTQHESRVVELETARQADRKKLALLEGHHREQLLERHNLLLALWNRLSTLCGTEWAHTHSLVNGKLPSLDVVSTQLAGFSKNLLVAVQTIEGLVGGFKVRIRSIEKEVWKEYQHLEHTLDARLKRLDRLEGIIQTEYTSAPNSSSEFARLKSENKQLRLELRAHPPHHAKRESSAPAPVRAVRGPAPRPPLSGPGPLSADEINPAALAALTRHYSASAVETLDKLGSASSGSQVSLQAGAGAGDASEQRWIHRLRELEKRLKAEREARLLDRSGARKRLEEGKAEYEELKMKMERDRVRSGPTTQ